MPSGVAGPAAQGRHLGLRRGRLGGGERGPRLRGLQLRLGGLGLGAQPCELGLGCGDGGIGRLWRAHALSLATGARGARHRACSRAIDRREDAGDEQRRSAPDQHRRSCRSASARAGTCG